MGNSNIIIDAKEFKDHIVLSLKRPDLRYLNFFISSRFGADLLEQKVFPNAKEVTESLAAFQPMFKCMESSKFGDSTIKMFDVCSGTTPRTAAVYACRTAWECTAIDPKLNVKKFYNIKRLNMVPKLVEDVYYECDGITVITMVHGHTQMSNVLDHIISPEQYFIYVPCCYPQYRLSATDHLPEGKTSYTWKLLSEKADWGIHSDKRTVLVYRIQR